VRAQLAQHRVDLPARVERVLVEVHVEVDAHAPERLANVIEDRDFGGMLEESIRGFVAQGVTCSPCSVPAMSVMYSPW